MIMSETCLHMLISLLLAAFLIVLFRTKTEELLGATLGALFSTQTIVILIGVCIVIFFITGLIPTYMFLRIRWLPHSVILKNPAGTGNFACCSYSFWQQPIWWHYCRLSISSMTIW